MLFVDVQVNGASTRKFFEDRSQGYGDFNYIRRLVRKEFGKESKVLTIGSMPQEKMTTWTPPEPPSFYSPANMKNSKFAFGRVRRVVHIPKDDDFEEDE